jgi:hypothetical protein
MPISNETLWNEYVDKNKDPYGKCCVDVAFEAMKLLDEVNLPIESDSKKEFSAFNIIIKADKNAKAGGITGFMAGAVASMVSQCHSRGEEFKIAWNISHGVKEEKQFIKNKQGVVNPAILEVKK